MRCATAFSLLASLALLCLVTAAPSASAAACPNEAIRQAQVSEVLPNGTTYLPACMALEMVSPPKKLGQEAGEVLAFSTDGSRVLFKSRAALAETQALQAFAGDSYVADRGTGGWTLSATSPPAAAQIALGGANGGGPFAFAPDLGAWSLVGATQRQKSVGEKQYFDGGPGGVFAPLSPLLVPVDESSLSPQFDDAQNSVSGTAADLSATVFRAIHPSTAYLAGDPRNTSETNSYLAYLDSAGNPALQLLARDQTGKVWGGRCGSHLGGGGGLNQGAISADGSRIFFTTRAGQAEPSAGEKAKGEFPACNSANPLRILKRTGAGPAIEELLPGGPGGPGDDLFQGASLDGSKVFLTTPRNLTASDLDAGSEPCGPTVGASKGCDLYLYDSSLPPGERLIQASAGGAGDPTPGKGANVLSSITAISPDGSHAYFAAQGVLTTTPNLAGASAVAGKPNLYLYQRDAAFPSGHTTFIATLAEADKEVLWGGGKSFLGGAYAVPLLGGGEEGGGDGHILFLASAAPLAPDDGDGGFRDIFRYDADTGSLQRISKAAPGGSEVPAANVSVNPASASGESPGSNFAELGRWASEDGETVAFATAEPLAPGDEDGAANPYLWREGQLVRLPGNLAKEEAVAQHQRPVVSPDGEEMGFNTTAPLLPQDGDNVRDVYLVRAGGGFVNPVTPTPCSPLSEGACQGPSSVQPGGPAPASSSFAGPGDPKAPTCKKGQVLKHGKCTKKAHHKKKHKKRASHKRRGNK